MERGGSCCDAGVFLAPNFDTLARASAKQLSGCRASEFEVLLSPIRRHRSPRFDANVLKSSALYHIFRVLPDSRRPLLPAAFSHRWGCQRSTRSALVRSRLQEGNRRRCMPSKQLPCSMKKTDLTGVVHRTHACAICGSVILSAAGSIFMSAEAFFHTIKEVSFD